MVPARPGRPGSCQNHLVKQWSVGGAVIESAVLEACSIELPGGPGGLDGLLMVQNLRRGGRIDWTPPGGVIDAGEHLVGGLTREVSEETGLTVTHWEGPLYRITAEAPGLGWTLTVEVHRALEVAGCLEVGRDPDGIVVAADVVSVRDCGPRMQGAHPWVSEPLLEWMDQRWSGTREFAYLVDGSDPDELHIERTTPRAAGGP